MLILQYLNLNYIIKLGTVTLVSSVCQWRLVHHTLGGGGAHSYEGVWNKPQEIQEV